MKTTLTAFRREFSKARLAADRGEIVEIRAGSNRGYVFALRPTAPRNPFADREHLFGVISLKATDEAARDRIRGRLLRNSAA
jgi:hypothetical protein